MRDGGGMDAGWRGCPPLSAAGSGSETGFCPKSGQTFPKVSQYMTNRNNHIKKAWQETDRATRAATIAMLITFAVFAAAFFFGGCSTTPAALSRDQRIYQTATNVSGRSQFCWQRSEPTMQLKWGAHASSRAVFRALAENRRGFDGSPFGEQCLPGFDRRGRRSKHARARQLTETNCIVTYKR